jgi:hypothetical protein
MMSGNMIAAPEALLSRALLTVLDALPHSTPSLLSSAYREYIQFRAEALDAIPMPTAGATPNHRASITCKASLILFGDAVVTPNDDNYEKQRQGNW